MSDSKIHNSPHDALVRAIANVGTVGEFAKKVGISPRTVTTWVFRKNGVPDRSIKMVPRIAKVTGVPVQELAPLVYADLPGVVG